MTDFSPIRQGSRVYLRGAICGQPGCVMGFDRTGKAIVDWSADMPEIGRWTTHALDTLVVDESFLVEQLGLEFDSVAA